MRFLILLIFVLCFNHVISQDTLQLVKVEDIQITATRIPVQLFKAPIAISNIELRPEISNLQGHSLLEVLSTAPGLYIQNQYNSAQDLRISIRGFGARSAFGIRGVRILMDDIPLSTPDGQGQVDNIFVNGIKGITMLNGSSSAIYGNAAGGVLSINTFSEGDTDQHLLDIGAGSFGDFRVSYQSHQALKNSKIDNQLSYAKHDGFRTHAQTSNFIYNGRYSRELRYDQEITFIVNAVSSPKGEDPGGVNLETVLDDRQAARQQNLDFNAGEELFQITTGLKYQKALNNNTKVKSLAYYTHRDFANRLPFENGGQVDLVRNYGGASAHINHNFDLGEWRNTILGGVDFAIQNDLRKRYVNSFGVRGDETLNQLEQFINQAAFISLQSEYKRLMFRAGLRFDNNQIKVEDFFDEDGISNGSLSLPSFSPSISMSYRLGAYQFFSTSYSFGFETPTLSELSSRPDNEGGFNTSLAPQQSHNIEVAYKAILSDRLSLRSALFNITSVDELLPYELEEFPGRTFYRNTGKTQRRGLELAINVKPVKYINVDLAYTYSDFRFKEFDEFSGNFIPGIPKHNFAGSAELKTKKWLLRYSIRMFSGIFADSENEVEVPFYKIGTMSVSRKIGAFRPYFGVNNSYNNTEYFDNIRLNAFGNRYYEAGPPRNYYIGLKFEF